MPFLLTRQQVLSYTSLQKGKQVLMECRSLAGNPNN